MGGSDYIPSGEMLACLPALTEKKKIIYFTQCLF